MGMIKAMVIVIHVESLAMVLFVLTFLTTVLWTCLDNYVIISSNFDEETNTAKIHSSYGGIRFAFIVAGCGVTKVLMNWVLMEGLSADMPSLSLAGLIGSATVSANLVFASYFYVLCELIEFQTSVIVASVVLAGSSAYGAVSLFALYVVRNRIHSEYSFFESYFGEVKTIICAVMFTFVYVHAAIWMLQESKQGESVHSIIANEAKCDHN